MGRCVNCVLCTAKFTVLLPVYFILTSYIIWHGIWREANEWDHFQCKNQPLPVNQSGVKVVLGGWAKSGTWTLSHALGQLGLNAYHSQEFLAHVYSPLADEYWKRPENGGRRSKTAVFRTLPWWIGEHGYFPSDNLEVVKNLKTERLARKISQCRPDAIALDGLEGLHDLVIDGSPDVKVIMLDWREYKAWLSSLRNQSEKMNKVNQFMELFYTAIHFLPWGLLVKAIDPYINNDIEKLLTTGGPPFIQKCPLGVMLWHPFIKNRQIYAHWNMRTWGKPNTPIVDPPSEATFKALFEGVKKKVPEKNILHWDFKKKGWEDLCSFLDIKDCPKSGKLATEPNGYTDLFRNGGRGWDFNCDEPFVLIPFYLILHWINWKVFTGVLIGLPSMLLRMLFGKQARDKVD